MYVQQPTVILAKKLSVAFQLHYHPTSLQKLPLFLLSYSLSMLPHSLPTLYHNWEQFHSTSIHLQQKLGQTSNPCAFASMFYKMIHRYDNNPSTLVEHQE